MSRSVDAAWKWVVQQLQQLAMAAQEQHQQQPSSSALANIQAALISLGTDKMRVPQAMWKQLIRELKVPLKLAKICCSLNYADSSSSSSSSSSSEAILAAFCAWQALHLFCIAALRDLITQDKSPHINNSARSNALPSALISQLQQSGLLQRLPSILAAAAEALRDSTRGAPRTPSSAAAAAAGTPAAATAPHSLKHFWALCGAVAAVCHDFVCIQPWPECQSEAAVLDATAAFCGVFLQAVTAVLEPQQQQQQQQEQQPAAVAHERVPQDWLYMPITHVTGALLQVLRGAWCGPNRPLQQLMQSPHMLTAAKILASMCYTYTLIPDASRASSITRADGDSADGGWSRNSLPHAAPTSSGRSDVAAAAAAAAASAVAQQHGCFRWLLPPDVPQHASPLSSSSSSSSSSMQLYAQPDLFASSTGVSARAVALAAALMSEFTAQMTVNAVLTRAPAMFYRCIMAMQQQQQRLQLQRDSLLLMQLLMCTLEQRPGIEKQGLPAAAATIAEETAQVINCIAEDSLATDDSTAWQVPSSGVSPAAAAALLVAATEAQSRQLLSRWFVCILPTLLVLLEGVLQQARGEVSTPQAACVATSTTGSSSSSSGVRRSANSSSSSSNSGPDKDVATRLRAMQLLVNVLATVVEHVPAEPAASLPSPGWSEHFLRICSTVEACLRISSSISSINSSRGLSGDPALLGYLAATVGQLLVLGSRPGRSLNAFGAAAIAAGPGSAEQRHLYSLLISYFKVCAALLETDDQVVRTTGWNGLVHVACTAAACLGASFPLDSLQMAAGSQPSALAAEGSDVHTAAAAAATSSLPALVLCGRSCLAWSQQLKVWQQQQQQQQPLELGKWLLLFRQQAAERGQAHAADLLDVHTLHPVVGLLSGPDAACVPFLQACRAWIKVDTTLEALCTAGFPARQVLQELGTLLDLFKAPWPPADPNAAVAMLESVVQQLQTVGLSANTLATPVACNNPLCSNMAGDTEVVSVSGRGNICGGCRVARYCSTTCQRQHWKQQHKPVCQAIKAAVAVRSAET